MYYAKVNSSGVLKFPYSWKELQDENPSTNFDNRFDLVGWYSQTNDAAQLSASLVPVRVEVVEPEYDSRTQKISHAPLPVFENGEYVLKMLILQKTEEEIKAWDGLTG